MDGVVPINCGNRQHFEELAVAVSQIPRICPWPRRLADNPRKASIRERPTVLVANELRLGIQLPADNVHYGPW